MGKRKAREFEVIVDKRYRYAVKASSAYVAGNVALAKHRTEMRNKIEILDVEPMASGRLNDPTWAK